MKKITNRKYPPPRGSAILRTGLRLALLLATLTAGMAFYPGIKELRLSGAPRAVRPVPHPAPRSLRMPAWYKTDPAATRRYRRALTLIGSAGPSLKDGDLVLRTGNDFTSQVLRQFSFRDKTYSHGGIVHIENGIPYVYHALGGEDNPDAALRRERFENFCDPVHNLGFGIYRYSLSGCEKHRLDSVVALFYRQKLPFDLQFDLHTNNRMYCAEFIYKALRLATGDDGYLPLSHLPGFTYVAVDNLFLNPHATEVCRVTYR
ncbi:hypothetical protein [Compostibacter hankyongensis]|uniref:Permuted papain-like amidase YaeF/Yiix C92 family enzyme n=1 Tax=Compostibacter hankyongensis TaxID=1007089 RepID=A0ABP8FQG2_9BACT